MANDDASELCADLIARLEAVIAERMQRLPEGSYTAQLLRGGAAVLAQKLREEADELAEELFETPPSASRAASEAADLFYHMLVALAFVGVSWHDVETELARRFGVSGLQEKARRNAPTAD